jgi:6-phosphogluconolactonase
MTLRSFLIASSALLLLCAPAGADGDKASKPDKLRVYIGTYTAPDKSKGIYFLDMDLATGKLSKPALAAETVNPSFLAIHPSHRFLFAVDEIADFKGKKTGAISAFAIQKDGTLKFLNRQPSKGAGPCHLVTDKKGKHILAANYGGGSVVVLPVADDGKLGEWTGWVQYKGHSANKDRQEASHAHSINLDKANRFAVAADLGTDDLNVHRYDPETGMLGKNDPSGAKVELGSGPRHFAFHPDGKHAYVINELNCTVTAFDYDGDKGVLNEIQTLSTLPAKFKPGYSTAEVQVHPSGKYLYGSNRGHNSIAVFAIDQETGKLKRLKNYATKGKTPRNFGIDPTGAYLVVANQDSDNVVVFAIEPTTGLLTDTGHTAQVPAPVCVKFMAPGK